MTESTPVAATLPPSSAGSQVLAELGTYPEAQHLVDHLSDEGFPFAHVRIIGTGIHSVEQVTGRLTKGRAGQRWPARRAAPGSDCSSA